jgi:hypothetical protein
MSATVLLENSLTKHMIYLQRYAAGINNDQADLFKDLAASLRTMLNDDLASFSETRLRVIIRQMESLTGETMAIYTGQVREELLELADYEAGFQLNKMQEVMTVPLTAVVPERIEALATQTQMRLVSGKTVKSMNLDEMFEDFANSVNTANAQALRTTINTGVAAGENPDTIARKVARKIEGQVGNTNGLIRTWSKTNLLTAVNHINQQARNEIVSANDDLLEFEKISATLDSHTSFYCMSVDGDRHRIGEGPYPPYHHRCRTVRLPYIPDEYAIIKSSERASVQGPVDSRTTYNSWLKKQDKEFQDDILGPDRAELFREGKVSVKDFVDDRGITLTLAELRARGL